MSEAKFSGIVSIAADAIISVDENQRITIFNEGAEAMFGYSKTEALGAPLEILIPERSAVDLVSEAVTMQTPLASSAGLEVRLDIGHDLRDVFGSRDRLLQ